MGSSILGSILPRSSPCARIKFNGITTKKSYCLKTQDFFIQVLKGICRVICKLSFAHLAQIQMSCLIPNLSLCVRKESSLAKDLLSVTLHAHCTVSQPTWKGVADGWGSSLCRGIRQPIKSLRRVLPASSCVFCDAR